MPLAVKAVLRGFSKKMECVKIVVSLLMRIARFVMIEQHVKNANLAILRTIESAWLVRVVLASNADFVMLVAALLVRKIGLLVMASAWIVALLKAV